MQLIFRLYGRLFILCLIFHPLQGQVDDQSLVTAINEDILEEDLSPETSHWRNVIRTSTCFTAHEKAQILDYLAPLPLLYSWYQIQVVPHVRMTALQCLIDQQDQGILLETRGEKDEKTRITIVSNTRSLTSPYLLLKLKSPLGKKNKVGLLIEKDIDEKFWTDTGPDFLSGYLERNWLTKNQRNTLIIGDYRLRLGQGLLFNTFFRRALSFDQLQIPSLSGKKIQAFHSLDENRGLRGIAYNTDLAKYSFTLFASFRQQDARLDTLGIVNFQYSGLHVGESGVKAKDALNVIQTGGSFAYTSDHGSITTNVIYTRFGEKWSDPTGIEKYSLPTSSSLFGLSADYSFRTRGVQHSGELALKGSGLAAIHTLFWNPHQAHHWSIMMRYATANYPGWTTQSFFKKAYQGNETGLFFGYFYKPSRSWKITLNADHYLFPWWTFRQYPYRQGQDWSASCLYQKRRKFKIIISSRRSNRLSRSNEVLVNERTSNHRIHFVKTFRHGVEWRSRAELSSRRLGDSTYKGWLMYQELKYAPMEHSWSILLRLTAFGTDGFEGRIYAYTHRLGGVFSIPAYHGSGYSSYVIYKKNFGRVRFNLRLNYVRSQNVDSGELQVDTGITMAI